MKLSARLMDVVSSRQITRWIGSTSRMSSPSPSLVLARVNSTGKFLQFIFLILCSVSALIFFLMKYWIYFNAIFLWFVSDLKFLLRRTGSDTAGRWIKWWSRLPRFSGSKMELSFRFPSPSINRIRTSVLVKSMLWLTSGISRRKAAEPTPSPLVISPSTFEASTPCANSDRTTPSTTSTSGWSGRSSSTTSPSTFQLCVGWSTSSRSSKWSVSKMFASKWLLGGTCRIKFACFTTPTLSGL